MLEDEDIFKLLVVKTAEERNMFTLVLSADAGTSLKYAEWDLINPYLTYIYIRLIRLNDQALPKKWELHIHNCFNMCKEESVSSDTNNVEPKEQGVEPENREMDLWVLLQPNSFASQINTLWCFCMC